MLCFFIIPIASLNLMRPLLKNSLYQLLHEDRKKMERNKILLSFCIYVYTAEKELSWKEMKIKAKKPDENI